jgi:hypothetical protein
MTYGKNPYYSQQISIKKIYIGTAAAIFPNLGTLPMKKESPVLI